MKIPFNKIVEISQDELSDLLLEKHNIRDLTLDSRIPTIQPKDKHFYFIEAFLRGETHTEMAFLAVWREEGQWYIIRSEHIFSFFLSSGTTPEKNRKTLKTSMKLMQEYSKNFKSYKEMVATFVL